MESHNTVLNWFGNIASVGAVVTSMLGYIPAIGAGVAIVWYSIQIYESDTMKRYRQDRLRRKLIRLHQQATELELHLTDPRDIEAITKLKNMTCQRIEVDAGLEQAHRDTQIPAAPAASERD